MLWRLSGTGEERVRLKAQENRRLLEPAQGPRAALHWGRGVVWGNCTGNEVRFMVH